MRNRRNKMINRRNRMINRRGQSIPRGQSTPRGSSGLSEAKEMNVLSKKQPRLISLIRCRP